MERLVAYHLACRECFDDRLRDRNFKVKGDGHKKLIMSRGESIILGIVHDSDVVIYSETNTMSQYSISERTRLVRLCDEFIS